MRQVLGESRLGLSPQEVSELAEALCPVLMSAFLGWVYFVSPNAAHVAAFDCT